MDNRTITMRRIEANDLTVTRTKKQNRIEKYSREADRPSMFSKVLGDFLIWKTRIVL